MLCVAVGTGSKKNRVGGEIWRESELWKRNKREKKNRNRICQGWINTGNKYTEIKEIGVMQQLERGCQICDRGNDKRVWKWVRKEVLQEERKEGKANLRVNEELLEICANLSQKKRKTSPAHESGKNVKDAWYEMHANSCLLKICRDKCRMSGEDIPNTV